MRQDVIDEFLALGVVAINCGRGNRAASGCRDGAAATAPWLNWRINIGEQAHARGHLHGG
jgi:hypothetical protein